MNKRLVLALFLIITSLLYAVPFACKADDETQIAVHRALGEIRDPEFDGPLTEFAPICSSKVEGTKAAVSIGVPSYCPYKDSIIALIKKHLSGVAGIETVEVELGECAKVCERKKTMRAPKPKECTITSASVSPEKVHPGDAMTVTASVFDPEGVASITADMAGIETIELGLVGGSAQEGTWQGIWNVHSTKLKDYTTVLKAKNIKGKNATYRIQWSDPADWWNLYYLYRKQITVTNNTVSTLATGYTTWITLDTATLIGAGKMRADGNDLRIFFWNGSTNVPLDRHLRYMNSANTEVYFKTQADIAGSGTDNNYYVYYGYSAASNPPVNGANVYEFFDHFDNLSYWSINQGAPSATASIVTLPANSAMYRNMGYAATTYNKVFEQCVKVDLSSAQKMWWGVEMYPIDYCGNQCCDNTYQGIRDLILIESVVNTVAQTSLTAVATPGTGDDTRSSSWSPGSDYNIYTEKWKASEVKYYHNRDPWATHAVDVSNSTNVALQFWNYTGSTTSFYADWYAVRRYVDPEPSTALAGEEEGEGPPPATTVGGATIRGGTIR